MKISTRGRYALRLMIDLAQNKEQGNISLKDVAKRQEISIKYLEQIATPLIRAGLIKSVRGAQGGYSLTRDMNKYTAKDILVAVEGPIACVACLETEPNQCPRYSECLTLPFYKGLNKVITDYLESYTLEDLADLHGYQIEYIISDNDGHSGKVSIERLYEAMLELDDNLKEVLLLKFWYKYSRKEMSQRLGVSEKTITNWKNKAFEYIKRYRRKRLNRDIRGP